MVLIQDGIKKHSLNKGTVRLTLRIWLSAVKVILLCIYCKCDVSCYYDQLIYAVPGGVEGKQTHTHTYIYIYFFSSVISISL